MREVRVSSVRWRNDTRLKKIASLPHLKCFRRLRSAVLDRYNVLRECNEELYSRFVFKRQAKGEQVDRRWLKSTMIVKELQPRGRKGSFKWGNFKASNGWLANFLKKYQISHQMQTEKKAISNATRIPLARLSSRSPTFTAGIFSVL